MPASTAARIIALGAVLALIAGAAAAAAQTAPPTKPDEAKKIMQEIAGDYDFEIQGQIITVNFFEKDGVLYGAPVGQPPEVMTPAPDSPLKFSTSPNGQLYELEFKRNDKKVIDRCLLRVMGEEALGAKRIK